MSFGYWSMGQFNQAFYNLIISYLANSHSVYPVFKQNTGLVSASPEISGEFTTSTDPELFFTFPQNNTRVYVGCTYQISWQSSTTIHSLESVLVDAGAGESVGPIASGLVKKNEIGPNSQSLDWKVGVVLPDEYYINASNINGVDLENYSKVFTISTMPKGISVDEREKICKESNSSF